MLNLYVNEIDWEAPGSTAAWLAQLAERHTAEREVTGSSPEGSSPEGSSPAGSSLVLCILWSNAPNILGPSSDMWPKKRNMLGLRLQNSLSFSRDIVGDAGIERREALVIHARA